MLFQRLYQPYPQDRQTIGLWRGGLVHGVVVAGFLAVFQPFGLHEPFPYKYPILVGYGLVTAVVTSVWNVALPRLFPKAFDEAHWVVWKEMALTALGIAAIGVANFVYATYVHDFPLTWRALGVSLGMTILVGIFPTALSVLWRQQHLLKQNLAQAQHLNNQLPHPTPEEPPTKPTASNLALRDEAGKLVLETPLQAFYYAVAAQNYVEVFHAEGSTLLRLSLKALTEQLAAHPQLLRTHRSYLVNLSAVVDVQGNAQGYRLTLSNGAVEVPVSRSRLVNFQTAFAALNDQ